MLRRTVIAVIAALGLGLGGPALAKGFVDETLGLMVRFYQNGGALFDGVSSSIDKVDASKLPDDKRRQLVSDLDTLIGPLDRLLSNKRIFLDDMRQYIASVRAHGYSPETHDLEWQQIQRDVDSLSGLVPQVVAAIDRSSVLGEAVDRQVLIDLKDTMNARTTLLVRFAGMEAPRTPAQISLLEDLARRHDELRAKSQKLRDALIGARGRIRV